MITPTSLLPKFKEVFNTDAAQFYFSPGRVNIIGEHIDFNGGLVLPFAISLGITALVKRNSTSQINVFSTAFDELTSFNLTEDLSIKSKTTWVNYIKGMAFLLQSKGISIQGCDILIANDLPPSSGLSSSAALECLAGFIFNKEYKNDMVSLALVAQRCENEYIGVNCGIMDQFSICLSKKDYATLLDCNSLEYQYVEYDNQDYQWLIINSNKPRELSKSEYNDRRRECEEAFEILKSFDAEAQNLCEINPISLAYLEDEILYARAKHVISENIRVQKMVNALKEDNIDAIGELLVESHRSLAEDFEVSCDELDAIVHYALKVDGCIGARMTGAGFGGCCIALVKKEQVTKFSNYVKKKYTEQTNLQADIYPVNFMDGVREVL